MPAGDAYAEFAEQHGLAHSETLPTEPLTPLLTYGSGLGPAMKGRLPNGPEASVGRFSYGRFTFNLAVTEAPESTAFAPRVLCINKGRSVSDTHYGFEVRTGRLWTESEKLNQRYEVTISPYQDDNWIRQLFIPTFIDYLAEHPLEDVSFELAFGTICTSVERDEIDLESLGQLCDAASTITTRVTEESKE